MNGPLPAELKFRENTANGGLGREKGSFHRSDRFARLSFYF